MFLLQVNGNLEKGPSQVLDIFKVTFYSMRPRLTFIPIKFSPSLLMEKESPDPLLFLNDTQSGPWLSLLSLSKVCVISGMTKTLAEAFKLRISQEHLIDSVN